MKNPPKERGSVPQPERARKAPDARKPPRRAWQSSQISRSRLTFPEQLVSRFVQTPFGTADICREVTDQFTRQFVDLGTFEVIDPQAPKVQNGRAQHPADAVASAVEYVSVHGARSVIGPAPVPQQAAPADREKLCAKAPRRDR
jgi:hypothetical protein